MLIDVSPAEAAAIVFALTQSGYHARRMSEEPHAMSAAMRRDDAEKAMRWWALATRVKILAQIDEGRPV